MNFFQKFRDFVSRPTHSRTMGAVIMLVLVSAITLTVYVAQQQQTLKQKAAEQSCDQCIAGCQTANESSKDTASCVSNTCKSCQSPNPATTICIKNGRFYNDTSGNVTQCCEGLQQCIDTGKCESSCSTTAPAPAADVIAGAHCNGDADCPGGETCVGISYTFSSCVPIGNPPVNSYCGTPGGAPNNSACDSGNCDSTLHCATSAPGAPGAGNTVTGGPTTNGTTGGAPGTPGAGKPTAKPVGTLCSTDNDCGDVSIMYCELNMKPEGEGIHPACQLRGGSTPGARAPQCTLTNYSTKCNLPPVCQKATGCTSDTDGQCLYGVDPAKEGKICSTVGNNICKQGVCVPSTSDNTNAGAGSAGSTTNTIIQLPQSVAFARLFTNKKNELIAKKDQSLTMSLYNLADNPSVSTAVASATPVSKISSSAVGYLNFDLGKTVPPGTYKVLLKSPKYLRTNVGTVTIAAATGQQLIPINSLTTSLTSGVAGDVDNNNTINIGDYNVIKSCFGTKKDSSSCTGKESADLNDDGAIDGVDYNIFLISLSTTRDGD